MTLTHIIKCKTADELQSQWLPMKGDVYADIKNGFVSGKPIVHIAGDLCGIVDELWIGENGANLGGAEGFCWIPDIEQLFNILRTYGYTLLDFLDYVYTRPIKEAKETLPDEILLDYFMLTIYQKRWTGERWERLN